MAQLLDGTSARNAGAKVGDVCSDAMPACPPARALFSDGIFNAQPVVDPPELVAVVLLIFWEGIFIARWRGIILIEIVFVIT